MSRIICLFKKGAGAHSRCFEPSNHLEDRESDFGTCALFNQKIKITRAAPNLNVPDARGDVTWNGQRCLKLMVFPFDFGPSFPRRRFQGKKSSMSEAQRRSESVTQDGHFQSQFLGVFLQPSTDQPNVRNKGVKLCHKEGH